MSIDLNLERGLPAAVDAERAILGAILLDEAAYYEATRSLLPFHFSLESHRRIFARMMELAVAGRALDLITITDELGKRKEIESVGGVAYVSDLMNGLPRRPSIAQYVIMVKERANQRELVHACSAAQAKAVDLESAASVWEFLEQQRLAQGSEAEDEPTFDEGMRQTLAKLLDSSTAGVSPGYPTGVAALDNPLSGDEALPPFGGWRPDELTYVGARPSVGKSALMVQGVMTNAHRGVVSQVFNLEMTRDQFNRRCIAHEALLHPNKLRYPETMTKRERERVGDAYEHFKRLAPFILLDSRKRLTAHQIASTTKQAIRKNKGKPFIAWVDYFTEIRMVNGKGMDAFGQEYRLACNAASLVLRQLSKEEHIPVICLAQLNRQDGRQETTPLLKDLRETGNLEQDADNVLLIDRPSQDGIFLDEGDQIILGKYRDGKRRPVPVRYSEERLCFL